MSRFLQLHFLTFYPPSNVNRDDTGAPKTATVGGFPRLRISSQALKRAWRTSPQFKKAFDGHMGQRTQRLAEEIFKHLCSKDVNEKTATDIAGKITEVFGKIKEKDGVLLTEQMVFISPDERNKTFSLAERMAAGEKFTLMKKENGKRKPTKEAESLLLSEADTAVDIALFGRMLANSPAKNREAAAQVAHAITTHRVIVEDDYYTAIDDLKTAETDSGASFISEAGFGSGVFYLYFCINLDLFKQNLGPKADEKLINIALAALIEAAAKVTPSGKQNSFAAHARAGYMLAEKGDDQPRTLAGAFAKPVTGQDLMQSSIKALASFRDDLDAVYGVSSGHESYEVALGKSDGHSLEKLIEFCQL